MESTAIFNLLRRVTDIKFNKSFSITNNRKKYSLDMDSKVLSKIYEIVIIDHLKKIVTKGGFEFVENTFQNKYPDFLVKSNQNKGKYYAIDIKTTYMSSETHVNGFTLGTYKGYFRDRSSASTIVVPYDDFLKHYCVCVVYNRPASKPVKKKVSLKNKLLTIWKSKPCIKKPWKAAQTPVKHIFVKEKWQLASQVAGSGNTTNIGSIKQIERLLSDNKKDAHFGNEKQFNEYWMKK